MKIWMVLLIIAVIAAIVLGLLYYFGNKMQKKQVAQKEQLNAAAQNVTMLVIDKKRVPLKDANLPKIVLEQTPKYLRRSKLPMVKAKIGPKVIDLISDEEIYDSIPVKAEVKAQISGLYIISVKNFRNAPVPEAPKKGFMAKLRSKQSEYTSQMAEENKKTKKK